MTPLLSGSMGRATRFAIGLLLYAVALPAHAATITVTNTNDNGPGSLRQALADVNDGDTINFAATGTIGLTSGELLVNKNVTISGPGTATLAVDGNFTSRVFHIGPGKTVSISDLTLTNGSADSENGGGILNDHAILTMDTCAVQNSYALSSHGGGIYNDGSGGGAALTILNSTVSLNRAAYSGGGIHNEDGTVTIMNSTIDGNGAAYNDFPVGGGQGGGIYNEDGMLIMTDSVVSNNYAGVPEKFPVGTGGGIWNSGTMTITDSTITSNQVYLGGGGIHNIGTLTITGSTVSGNVASGEHEGQPFGSGGGISGTVTLTNSTLSGNYAAVSGGGLDGGGVTKNSTISGNGNGGISTDGMEIGNTILDGNSGTNIDGTATSLGYNISSDDGGGNLTGPGDQINTDPMVGPLQDNGGRTLTHALLPGSPAINTGDPNFTPPPLYDQRGSPFVRVFNGRIDIGAFEVQPPRGPDPTPRPRPTPRPTTPFRNTLQRVCHDTLPWLISVSLDASVWTHTTSFLTRLA